MDTAECGGERHLIEQTLAGDRESFGLLVQSHQTAVYNIAYRLLGNREEASDAAQEAFWMAYRGLDRFELGRPLAPWLYRIATNVSLNRLRKTALQTVSLDVLGPGQQDTARPLQLRDPAPGPVEHLLRAESQAMIRNAILALAPADRAVIELRHFQGLSYKEIAAVLGASISSVKSRLFRARGRLRSLMEPVFE